MADSFYKSKELGRNLILFEELTFARNIAPTDIDFMLESRGEIMIFGEFKHRASPKMTVGQKILFQNLISNLNIPAICFLAVHDYEGDIIAKDCRIHGVYYNKHFKQVDHNKWISKNWNELSVKTFLNIIAKKYNFNL